MSTLRVSNIEAKADPSSPTINEKVKITNSNGDVMLQLDGATSGITTVGINTTTAAFTVDANQNIEFVGGITAAKVNTTGVSTFTAGINVTGGRVGLGTDNPGRLLHLHTNGAAEQVWEQGDGKADRKKFNLVVDGGSSTVDSTIYLRYLNDDYSGGNYIWSYVGAGGTHRFYNGSGSVIQTMYNDGNIQKPLQSFCDTGDTTSYGAGGSLVSSPASAKGNWSSTVANVGNDFSTSTDLYTCPQSGVYAISCTCSIDNLTPAPYRSIFVLSFNGTYEEITELFDTYENQSPCVMRKLNANDTIGLGINGGGGSSFHVRLQVYYLG